jgi:glucokinase
MQEDVTVGIDIGGTNTKIGLVDRMGNHVASCAIKTNTQGGFPALVACIYQQITALSNPQTHICAIGIGAPCVNPTKGTIEYAVNLDLEQVNIIQLFQQYFDLPIELTNDANAAALGEMMFGGAKGMKNFAVVTLGTGLGCGIVANGELIQGVNGFAGELGHVIVKRQGRYCQCGRRGCLETYASATGICRTVYKLIADHIAESELKRVSFDKLNAEMITDAAKRGDRIAIEAFTYTGEILGSKLADLVMYHDPEAIFLFGGLVKAGNLLLHPTKESMEKNILKIYQNKVKVLPSLLQNENAAILGAAALAWKALEK